MGNRGNKGSGLRFVTISTLPPYFLLNLFPLFPLDIANTNAHTGANPGRK